MIFRGRTVTKIRDVESLKTIFFGDGLVFQSPTPTPPFLQDSSGKRKLLNRPSSIVWAPVTSRTVPYRTPTSARLYVWTVCRSVLCDRHGRVATVVPVLPPLPVVTVRPVGSSGNQSFGLEIFVQIQRSEGRIRRHL